MNARIRDYCLRRGCSIFEVEGGLEYLVLTWERTVADIARGYPGLLAQQFAGDLRTRQLLHEVWPLATVEERQEFGGRLQRADASYLEHTVPSSAPLEVAAPKGAGFTELDGASPRGNARGDGGTWWLGREPKVRDADW